MSKNTIQGTLSSIFQIGKRGPLISIISGVFRFRDSTNTNLANIEIADPLISSHAATKLYVDSSVGGSVGTALIDFGPFPGKSDVTLNITGQAGIGLSSTVEAWISPMDTVDHLFDEHLVDSPAIYAGNIVVGVGFTIYAVTKDQQRKYGKWSVGWRWR